MPKKKTTALQRLSELERAERRNQIVKLRLRGLQNKAIAKLLGVTPETISKEMKIIKQQNAEAVATFDQEAFIGEALSMFKEVQERAFAEHATAKKPGERIKALDLIRTTQNDKIKAMRDLGLVQNQPQQIEVTQVQRIDWSPDVKAHVAKTLIEQALVQQLEEPIPEAEVIDVTPVGENDELRRDAEDESSEGETATEEETDEGTDTNAN